MKKLFFVLLLSSLLSGVAGQYSIKLFDNEKKALLISSIYFNQKANFICEIKIDSAALLQVSNNKYDSGYSLLYHNGIISDTISFFNILSSKSFPLKYILIKNQKIFFEKEGIIKIYGLKTYRRRTTKLVGN